MKRNYMMVGLLSAMAAFPCWAGSELFTYVTNEWYQCRKANVMRVAAGRLATNASDVVGLLLNLEYDMAYANNATYTNSIERFRAAAQGISTPKFQKCKRFLPLDLDSLMLFATNSPNSELTKEDIDKANKFHKRMSFLEEFRALDEDGFTAWDESRHFAPILLFQ